MSAIVQIKRSEVPNRTPSTAELAVGELAINLEDAKLFSKKEDGSIVTLAQTTNEYTSFYLPNDLGDLSPAGNTWDLGEITENVPAAADAGFNDLTAVTLEVGDYRLPEFDGAIGQVLTTNGEGTTYWSEGDGAVPWIERSSNHFATSGEKIIVNVSSNPVTITLPPNPSFGDQISIIDGTSNAGVNNITIARNGRSIDFTNEDLTIDVSGAACNIVYYNSTYGWLFTER